MVKILPFPRSRPDAEGPYEGPSPGEAGTEAQTLRMMGNRRTPEEARADIGKRLRWSREALGISAAELSRLFGYRDNTLSQWETGRNPPNPTKLVLFCDVYGISLDWLYRGSLAGPLPDDFRQEMRERMAEEANGENPPGARRAVGS